MNISIGFSSVRFQLGLFVALACLFLNEAFSASSPWIDPDLMAPPKVEWRDSIGPDFELVYDNVPYEGKMARVLAYFSVPANITEKVPAMVLVHGGAGQAFPQWARQWADYGYAAIAMDLGRIGSTPSPDGRPWDAENFNVIGKIAVEDTWYYHSVAAIIRSISFVSSRPEVDSNRIGVMGISWGGFLTSIVSGVDRRLALAVPVFGCGFIHLNSWWSPISNDAYLKTFDPGLYLPRATLPMLWVTGAPDSHYPLPIFRKSYRSVKGDISLHIEKGLVHGYETTWKTREIRAFVDSRFKSGARLPKITSWGWDAASAWIEFESVSGISKADLIYSRRVDTWKDFRTTPWESQPVEIPASQAKVSSPIPDGARVFYFCIQDSAGNMVSSQHVDLSVDPASGSLAPATARDLDDATGLGIGEPAGTVPRLIQVDLNGRRLGPLPARGQTIRFPVR